MSAEVDSLMGHGGFTPAEREFLDDALGHSLAARSAGESAMRHAEQIQQEDGRTSFLRRVLRPPSRDERNWARGARGEVAVGSALERLPAGWWVLNDVPVGSRGANIDHVVIGPGGVFTLNTKTSTGHVWVSSRVLLINGARTDYLPKARAEAARASRLLTRSTGFEVVALPVLVVLARQFTLREPADGVAVVEGRQIIRWLTSRAPRLSRDAVVEVMAQADRPETWQDSKSRKSRSSRSRSSGRAREVAAPRTARTGQPASFSVPPPPPPPPPATEYRSVVGGPIPPPPPPFRVEVPAEPTDPRSASDTPCPCGGQVVLRRRRSDGHPFYGCTNFPACRRTSELAK